MDARGRHPSATGRAVAVGIAAAAAAMVAVAPAGADPRIRAEAERRNRVANGLYEQGRYESALQMYQSAYDLLPAPKFLFNIGLAKEKVFDYEGCALAFRDFLRQSGEAGAEAAVREAAEVRLEACRQKTLIPVRLTSVPTNAAIYIGEGEQRELRGRTPQQLELTPGPHRVTVELEGHIPQSQLVDVQVGTRPDADFVLEKLSTLRVEVDPGGARVSVGGGPWEVAPVEREVRAGSYDVRAEKAGYEPTRRRLRVTSGQEVSLLLSLRPRPKIRALEVTLAGPRAPAAARVEVDGNAAGAPPARTELGAGLHRVRVTAPGHLPYAASITVPEQRDLALRVTLRPVRSRRSRGLLLGLVGAAGAAALVGAGYGALALVDQAAFADDKTDVALHRRGELRAERADWALGTAAVLGAGAAAYYYLSRPRPSSGRTE